MAHADRRRHRKRTRTQWVYFAAALALTIAVLAVIALWTSSQPRSGALPVGSATPSITLPATTGGGFTLAWLRGSKVVLYFYEGAG